MNRENLFIYTGQSMKPLFKEAEILRITPCNGDEVSDGDVIVFRLPEDDAFIIHRVVSVTPNGIRTKGDNNSELDSWFVKQEHIIGRVERTGLCSIKGGRAGRLFLSILKGYPRVKRMLVSVLSPLYHRLSEKASLSRLTARIAPLCVIAMDKREGSELQLMMGRHLIGRLSPMSDKWEIKRPFRVFINERTLPKG